MPTAPKSQKRPADVVGAAVKVMRIATGEEPEDYGGVALHPLNDSKKIRVIVRQLIQIFDQEGQMVNQRVQLRS